MTLDTGSSDLVRFVLLFIPMFTPSEVDTVEQLLIFRNRRSHAKYSPSSTSSLLLDVPFELDYLLGSVTGCIAFDAVSLGPYQLSSQIFGE